jgi:drug/metabolite transporter (DMT)-like permease
MTHDLTSGRPDPTILLWCLMTVMAASAAILTRYCGIPASSIGFWRVAGAACVLLPWWLATFLKTRSRAPLSRGAAITGLFLGIHFATWAWALLHASLANAALFISMQPAVTPLIGFWLAGDRLNRNELVGTALACAGMIWILGGQVFFTPDQVPGSLVALFSMVCCAVYFVLARRYRAREHVILFTAPVYVVAALAQALLAVSAGKGITLGTETSGWIAIAGMILVPTVGGHTLSIFLLRRLKAHTVVLSIPLQFVLIVLAGIVLFREIPKMWFYPGAAIVVAGVVLAILSSVPEKGPVKQRGAKRTPLKNGG